MSMRALLLSAEPLAVAVGSRRLIGAGFEVEVETKPTAVLRRLLGGGVSLCIVDLDLEGGLEPAPAFSLMQAAQSTRTVLVAISAVYEVTHGWPLSAAKPFTSEQVRGWCPAGERLGLSNLTPISVERLAENLGGSLQDVLETLRDYESMAMPQHDALRVAIADQDWNAVGEIAHRVCGALGAIEASEAAAMCRQLMNAASARDMTTAALLGPRVIGLLAEVERSVTRHTGGGRPDHQLMAG